MRVLLYVNNATGHEMMYLRLLAEGLVRLPATIIVALASGVDANAKIASQLENLRRQGVEVHPVLTPVDASRTAGPQLQSQLLDAIARFRPEHVYVPTGDGISQQMGSVLHPKLPIGVEAESVVHRIAAAYDRGWVALVKSRISLHAIQRAPWHRVHTPDALAYEWVRSRHISLARRLHLLPDPIEPQPLLDRTEARLRFRIDPTALCIGTAGAISSRKGIPQLVRAFENADLPANAQLFIAGPFDSEFRRNFDRDFTGPLRDRLIIHDAYMTVPEISAALSAMDVVCTPYLAHPSIASTILRAVAAKRPVLSSDFGWMGWITNRFKLGVTCDVRDPATFAKAIRRAIVISSDYHTSQAAAALMQFHHPDNFIAHMTSRLRDRLGLPPVTRLDWSEVLKLTNDSITVADASP